MIYSDRQLVILIIFTLLFCFFGYYLLGFILHGCCIGVYEGEDDFAQDPDDELDEEDFFEDLDYNEHMFVYDIRYDLSVHESYYNDYIYLKNQSVIDNP
jgi:hypothetical protein